LLPYCLSFSLSDLGEKHKNKTGCQLYEYDIAWKIVERRWYLCVYHGYDTITMH